MFREKAHPTVYAIGAFRTFGGISQWFAPTLVARVYGGGAPDPRVLLWSRLASSREIALALGPILSDAAKERQRWLLLGLACDFADMAATLIGRRRLNPLSRRTTGLALATYSVSALLTVSAIRSTVANVTVPEQDAQADS